MRYGVLKRRTLAALREMQGKGKGELEALDNELLNFIRPISYSGSNGLEVQRIKSFERSLTLIAKELSIPTGGITVLRYLENMDLLNEIMSERKKKRHHT